MENQNWRKDIQEKLNERNIIAMESVGILNYEDVSKSLAAIDALEAEEHVMQTQQARTE